MKNLLIERERRGEGQEASNGCLRCCGSWLWQPGTRVGASVFVVWCGVASRVSTLPEPRGRSFPHSLAQLFCSLFLLGGREREWIFREAVATGDTPDVDLRGPGGMWAGGWYEYYWGFLPFIFFYYREVGPGCWGDLVRGGMISGCGDDKRDEDWRSWTWMKR